MLTYGTPKGTQLMMIIIKVMMYMMISTYAMIMLKLQGDSEHSGNSGVPPGTKHRNSLPMTVYTGIKVT